MFGLIVFSFCLTVYLSGFSIDDEVSFAEESKSPTYRSKCLFTAYVVISGYSNFLIRTDWNRKLKNATEMKQLNRNWCRCSQSSQNWDQNLWKSRWKPKAGDVKMSISFYLYRSGLCYVHVMKKNTRVPWVISIYGEWT